MVASLSLADKAMASYTQLLGAAGVAGRSLADLAFQGVTLAGTELGYAEIAANFDTLSAVDVDVPGLSLPIVGTGRPILLIVAGMSTNNAVQTNIISIKDEANTLLYLGSDRITTAATSQPFQFTKRVNPAAGVAKTYKVTMRVVGGTGTLYATAPDTTFLQAIAL